MQRFILENAATDSGYPHHVCKRRQLLENYNENFSAIRNIEEDSQNY